MKVIFTILLIASLCGFAQAEFFRYDWPSVEDLSDISNSVQSYLLSGAPRRTFSGPPASGQFCSYNTETQTCDWVSYAQSVGLLLVPGVVIGVLSILVLIIFCLVRACGCCYDKTQTATPRQLVTLKIAIIINVILIGVLLIVAFVGNSKVSSGASDATGGILSFADEIQGVIANVSQELATYNVSLDINSTLNSISGLSVQAHTTRDEFLHYENIRKSVFIAGYVLLILMCILALVSCFIWLCFSGQINCCCGLIQIIFMWVIFTLGIGLGTVVTDVCTTFDNQLDNSQTGVTVNGVLGSFIGEWGSNCTAFEVLKADAYSKYYDIADQLCSEYNDFCTNPKYAPFILKCGNCSRGVVYSDLKTTTIVNDLLQCPDSRCPIGFCSAQPNGYPCMYTNRTLDNCANSCYNDQLKSATSQIRTYLPILDGIKGVLDYLAPYLGCQLITMFITAVHEPLCNEFLSGISMLFVASAIIGLLLIAFVIQALLAIHVFDPTLDAIYPEDEEAYTGASLGTADPNRASQQKLKRSMTTGTVGFFSAKTFSVQSSGAAGGEGGFRVSQLSRHSSTFSMKDMKDVKQTSPHASTPHHDVKSVEMSTGNATRDSRSASSVSDDDQEVPPMYGNEHRKSHPPPTNPELD